MIADRELKLCRIKNYQRFWRCFWSNISCSSNQDQRFETWKLWQRLKFAAWRGKVSCIFQKPQLFLALNSSIPFCFLFIEFHNFSWKFLLFMFFLLRSTRVNAKNSQKSRRENRMLIYSEKMRWWNFNLFVFILSCWFEFHGNLLTEILYLCFYVAQVLELFLEQVQSRMILEILNFSYKLIFKVWTTFTSFQRAF